MWQYKFLIGLCIIYNCCHKCENFLVPPQKTERTQLPETTSSQRNDQVKTEATILNTPQSVEYDEDTNANPKSHPSMMTEKCDPCPEGILCIPQIQCPAHIRMKDYEKPQVCDLPGGKFGFCCVSGQNHTDSRSNKARLASHTFLSPSVVEEARFRFENLMHKMAMIPVMPGQPEFVHNMVFHSSLHEDLQNFQLSNSAMEQIITTQVFTEQEHIPVDDIITNNIDVEFRQTPLEEHCQPPRPCLNPRSRYRSFDGSCNNILPHRSHWGAAGQPMERLLPPAYEDGIWTPRIHAKDGSLLTGAREISRILLGDADRPHPRYNLLLMQFGQFIAHDVTQSATVRLENGEAVQCCAPKNAGILPAHQRHFACMPIPVEMHDEFYSNFGIRCMNFVRLSLAPNTDCRAGYGKQRSKVTHFLDASPVYGSSMETARELRMFRGGKLRMFNDFGRDMLPLTNDKSACGNDDPSSTCFKSGDGRTNQIISLIAVHIIFAREHNRIAGILSKINPHASDEMLYQEARRIVIAEMQHIIYNEYLPSVIGPMQMKRFRLVPQHHGYSRDYNNEVNPAITNAFSGAAFRMGHSSVAGKFHIHQKAGHVDEVINIPDVMFNPSRMRIRTFYDDMLLTMLQQPMQKVDSAVTHGLSRFLFRGHNPFGLDLAAFNIQRGRDQGLRSYNDYMELMGNRRIHRFEELPPEVGRKLSLVYHHPDDVDLWVGGLLENSVEGGIVGATFAEIIADQFSRFKFGDRYYYEYNSGTNPGAFTIDQLHEIRKVSMARLICDNADHLTLHEVPPAAFMRTDLPGNSPVRCDSPQIPVVDLGAWRFN
ncbi:chorion peroxidase [Haematobia irritans]|uniref:chorion peroxidase n=1 Tax=Haematobia irritans TaxID=7368 RepID=UPI003F4F5981